jgi:ketosteroid isomerase-like protein
LDGRVEGTQEGMSDQTPARAFASALQEFESSGDAGTLVGMFADGAELLRPEVGKSGSSTSDPGAYWEAYRAQFDELSTTFDHVQESDSLAALEWHSTGKLTTGRDITYHGVSLLTLDDGKVSRFATYYDTAAFLESAA